MGEIAHRGAGSRGPDAVSDGFCENNTSHPAPAERRRATRVARDGRLGPNVIALKVPVDTGEHSRKGLGEAARLAFTMCGRCSGVTSRSPPRSTRLNLNTFEEIDRGEEVLARLPFSCPWSRQGESPLQPTADM